MAEATVYIGPWIDWSKGRIFGATLTTTATQRGLLVAFVAVFVGTAGGSLWQIINFMIHRARLKDQAQDGLFHQQQVVFRNASSPAVAAWKQLELSWFWRNRARGGSFRSMPYVILASLYLVTLQVASVFSSRVSRSTSAVLVRSPRCGYLNGTSSDDNATLASELFALWSYHTQLYTEGFNYIQACNESSSLLPSLGNCGIFGDDPFGEMSVSEELCPFAEGTCLDPEHGVIGLDTGLLDTNRDLGINSPYPLFIRKTTICAPLQTQPFTTTFLSNNTVTNGSVVYSYGATNDGLPSVLDNGNGTADGYDSVPANSTCVLLPSQQDIDSRFLNVLPSLQLWGQASFAGDTSNSSNFDPINDFNQTDIDVTLLFLINNNFYQNPVHDLWFDSLDTTGPPESFYYRESPQVSVLGCSEQYQICASAEEPESCAKKQGLVQIQTTEGFHDLDLNAPQLALASHVVQMLDYFSISNVVAFLGPGVLDDFGNIHPKSGYSSGLPDDQWRREVLKFAKIGQIALRQALIDFAAGPPSRDWELLLQPPEEGSIAQSFYLGQKIHTADYTSFSLLGLGVIFVVGGFLIILNLVLPLLVSLATNPRSHLHAYDPWLQDDPLHLQQRAFEESGLGTWEGRDTDVPVTARGQTMRPPWYKTPRPMFGATHSKPTARSLADADLDDDDEAVLLRPIPSTGKFSDRGMDRRATQDTLNSLDTREATEPH